MPPIIELKTVSKCYENNHFSITALRNINLTVDKGEFLCIAGPSGSGKSTLLHITGILDTPSTGTVLINNQATEKLSRTAAAVFRRYHIGFIFQKFNLIPVLTAFENVEYILTLQHKTAEQRKRDVEKVLDAVGLSQFMHQKTNTLSGGQQQRVAVARAMVANPPIIIADEPTGSLDSVTGSALIDLFASINKQQSTTFIFSSHDPKIIQRANRIINLRDGEINLYG